jgi:colicin import membrane protein
LGQAAIIFAADIKNRRYKMFDFHSILGFLAINDAAREAEREEQEELLRCEEERQREEAEFQREKEAHELEMKRWEESQRQEKQNRERDRLRSEREQLEWEMNNADFYHYDKEEIQRRLDDLEDKECDLE